MKNEEVTYLGYIMIPKGIKQINGFPGLLVY